MTLESTPLADQQGGGWSIYHDLDNPELPHSFGLQNGGDRVFVAFHPDHRARGADVFNLQLQSLTRGQVEQLRDELTRWLGQVGIVLTREKAEAALISPLAQGKDGQRRGRALGYMLSELERALRTTTKED